eukprot:gene1504-2809_t
MGYPLCGGRCKDCRQINSTFPESPFKATGDPKRDENLNKERNWISGPKITYDDPKPLLGDDMRIKETMRHYYPYRRPPSSVPKLGPKKAQPQWLFNGPLFAVCPGPAHTYGTWFGPAQ